MGADERALERCVWWIWKAGPGAWGGRWGGAGGNREQMSWAGELMLTSWAVANTWNRRGSNSLKSRAALGHEPWENDTSSSGPSLIRFLSFYSVWFLSACVSVSLPLTPSSASPPPGSWIAGTTSKMDSLPPVSLSSQQQGCSLHSIKSTFFWGVQNWPIEPSWTSHFSQHKNKTQGSPRVSCEMKPQPPAAPLRPGPRPVFFLDQISAERPGRLNHL